VVPNITFPQKEVNRPPQLTQIYLQPLGEYAQYLAGPSLLLPNNKQFAVDVKRIEGTMAAISDQPIKRVDPAVVIEISPIRFSQSKAG
jgi:hypothetical protein